jgi:phosphoribosylformylglycinamidine synthase
VVTVHPENQKAFEDALKENIFAPIGRVATGNDFTVIGLQGTAVVRADIFDLKETWKRPLRW